MHDGGMSIGLNILFMREELIRRAVWLSGFTIVWNLVESLVSIFFGVGDRSLSLLGFGIDSLIEVASGALVLWRFWGESAGRERSLTRERRATFGIGLLFVGLGVGTGVGGAFELWRRARPLTTVPGMVISLVCIGAMIWLWRAKMTVARGLGSSTVEKDAACSLACAKLSGILLAGSLMSLLAPNLWWADGVAAVALACLFLREGWETLEATRSPDFKGGCSCGCPH